MLPRAGLFPVWMERGHGVRVQIELESEMYQGILGIEFSALSTWVQNIEDQSKCRKKNNQDFWCKADCPSGSLCVLLFLCWKRRRVAWCVVVCGWPAGRPGLLQNWFWGGAAESWKPEALQKLPDVSLSHSWDYLWVANEMLKQQHEALFNLAFKRQCLFFRLSRKLKGHYEPLELN